MALSQNLVQKQTQKLVITQDLRQSIELLPLSNLELVEKIQKEVLENPMLEIKEDADRPEMPIADVPAETPLRADDSGDPADSGDSLNPADTVMDGTSSYLEPYRPPPQDFEASFAAGQEKSEKKHQFLQNQLHIAESLADHLLWQLRLSNLTEKQMEAAEFLVSCIDQKGYLADSVANLIQDSDILPEDARAALEQINRCDPVGCGATSIAECLTLQIQILYPREVNALTILREHFDSLEKLDFKKIEKPGLTEAEIEAALSLIKSLEPYPGTLYSPPRNDYIIPDMSVQEVDGKFEIFVQDEWVPDLKINEEYRSMMRTQKNFSGEDRDYLQTKLNSASWLIKSIKQRRDSMVSVMRSIVKHQENFFVSGPGHLKPLTLRDISSDVELHESTVSRITTNKYVQTKWGIFELKHFFSSSLKNADGGDDHSARNIKERLQQIVSQETEPMSDQEIVEVLRKEGVEIARRTVAKYRKLLRILPADRRKKLQNLKKQPVVEKRESVN